jgi:hypothetical protein
MGFSAAAASERTSSTLLCDNSKKLEIAASLYESSGNKKILAAVRERGCQPQFGPIIVKALRGHAHDRSTARSTYFTKESVLVWFE